MGRRWERIYPVLLALLSTALLFIVGFLPCIKGFEKVLDGTITFVSIVIGFLAALLAIILSISKSKVMLHLYEYIDADNGKNILYSFFQQSIISGFVAVIFSIWMYVIQNQSPISIYGTFVFVIWLFTAIFFVLSAYRLINLLMMALFIEAKPRKAEPIQSNAMPKDQLESFKKDSTR